MPPEEVEKRIAQAARVLGRNMRVPGFRAGKAPAPVVIKRVGREAVLDEAVRDSIGSWYSAAIDAAAIVPVGEPDLDMGELPGQGQPLTFSIEIGVRPKAKLGEYKGLEVGKREPGCLRRGGRGRGRAAARARRPARDRRARGGRRATSSSWTTWARSTARRSPAARAATR